MGGGVGLLLIRSWVLGNEAHENRNGVLQNFAVRDSPLMGKSSIHTRLVQSPTAAPPCIRLRRKSLR